MLEEVQRAEKDGFDAVIISCFDDPFLYLSREISQKIVVTAPGEASMHLAAMLGNQFSVIVGRDKWIPQMKENVHRYGLESKLASFRSLGMGVLEFHQDEEETVRRMKREIRSAIETDRAEVIILGCSMQFGFYEELQEEFQVPVIDSMVASLKHTEYLLQVREQTGWCFSRRGLYERPPEQEM
ncbi:aspartate/glutamate racemase family protein [Extibacter muris]|uniref:aspartate/glutamate racemase family protein n=1 Tax=Extibacter muris TaxID=1796622 RepID=UPI0021C9C2C1|nr:aspartate/glutamate racemase family protein [Extibacter muris]MCU0079935.1 aspartate/glutamate racemase family protein [Extibacter muris]